MTLFSTNVKNLFTPDFKIKFKKIKFKTKFKKIKVPKITLGTQIKKPSFKI